MRFSPPAIALSLLLATVSSVSHTQPAERAINPRSVILLDAGYVAQQAGEYDEATNLYEAALAVDPANRSAFIALAQIARAQNLPGKAVRLYREALVLNPNDLTALSGQGEALIQRGAVEKARRNLARIETLCRTRCAEADTLAAALKNQAEVPVLSAEAVSIEPIVTGGETEQP